MLLIRELGRLARNIVAFSVRSRSISVLVVVLLVAVATVIGLGITTVGPYVVYPLL